jgi:hypothetical protein
MKTTQIPFTFYPLPDPMIEPTTKVKHELADLTVRSALLVALGCHSERIRCHPEPIRYAQGELREGSRYFAQGGPGEESPL